jgi:hypothetical protein
MVDPSFFFKTTNRRIDARFKKTTNCRIDDAHQLCYNSPPSQRGKRDPMYLTEKGGANGPPHWIYFTYVAAWMIEV